MTQADALRANLSAIAFDRVLYSPLQRARETCARAGLLDGAEEVPDAMEWDYGEYEGRTTTEIRAERTAWQIWRDGVLGGETIDDVGARADRVIALVAEDLDADKRIAIFAHGHFLRILAARWLAQPPTFGAHLALFPSRTGVLGFEHETHAIHC